MNNTLIFIILIMIVNFSLLIYIIFRKKNNNVTFQKNNNVTFPKNNNFMLEEEEPIGNDIVLKYPSLELKQLDTKKINKKWEKNGFFSISKYLKNHIDYLNQYIDYVEKYFPNIVSVIYNNNKGC